MLFRSPPTHLPTHLAGTHPPTRRPPLPMQSLACVKGKNVLRKEPMSREVNEGDVFSVNDAFTSKLYKVKIGMVAAQVNPREEVGRRGRWWRWRALGLWCKGLWCKGHDSARRRRTLGGGEEAGAWGKAAGVGAW